MSVSKQNDDISVPLQEKVFTRWITSELQGVQNLNFTDITKDLSNGVALIELAQVLTHKKAPQDWENQPTSTVQCAQNCKLAFKMFRNDGFKPIGITSKDISDNNEKQILELSWQLISHYSIEKCFGNLNTKINVSEVNSQSQLLSWAIKRTQNYKRVFAFKPYDLAMCALLDSYYPSKINYYVLDQKDHQKNFKLMMDVMNELKIPCLIYPEDVLPNNDQVDRKILLAQLAFLRIKLDSKSVSKNKRRSNSRIQRKVDSTIIIRDTPINSQNKVNRLHQTQIAKQNRPKNELRNTPSSSKTTAFSRIPQKVKNNIDFNKDMKPDQLRKEIQKFKDMDAKNLIPEDFDENQGQNEIVNKINTEKVEPIENEKKVKSKSSHLKIEKQDIEAEIADEFRENEDSFKKQIENEKREEKLTQKADRRPQYINFV